MNSKAIGVFDSGIGGLTVLDTMLDIFKNEDFIYVADQGHCPYGTKTDEEITENVLRVGRYLLSRGVKAIVIACNTASLFIEKLRAITDIPVISVIDPTAEYAMKLSKNKKIAVLATKATIRKGAYQERLEKKGYIPYPVAASEFVDFVENNELDDPKGKELVHEKVKELLGTGIDTLIHGCTHFSLLEGRMKETLGELNYVACGYPTSLALKEILEAKSLLNEEKHDRFVEINTTGNKENALMTMKWFKKPHMEIKEINID